MPLKPKSSVAVPWRVMGPRLGLVDIGLQGAGINHQPTRERIGAAEDKGTAVGAAEDDDEAPPLLSAMMELMVTAVALMATSSSLLEPTNTLPVAGAIMRLPPVPAEFNRPVSVSVGWRSRDGYTRNDSVGENLKRMHFRRRRASYSLLSCNSLWQCLRLWAKQFDRLSR